MSKSIKSHRRMSMIHRQMFNNPPSDAATYVSAAAVKIFRAPSMSFGGIYRPCSRIGRARRKLASHSTGKVTRCTNAPMDITASPASNTRHPGRCTDTITFH